MKPLKWRRLVELSRMGERVREGGGAGEGGGGEGAPPHGLGR